MSTKKIAVLIGSLRKESFNRKMAKVLVELAPASLAPDIVEIGDLPFYNEDLETEQAPAPWLAFREKIAACDGLLFLTPEYNRSVPAVLKNALDVGSRPYGQNVWNNKPAAVLSLSLGALGGFGANHHLRQSLTCLNVPVMQQPEAYLGNAPTLFDENGQLTKADTKEFLASFMQAFAAWSDKFNAA
ncbi:MAG: NAD(P)H-dependent oxidoreductase [Desulfobulbaceae bacterium]|nr:NAD(P)H-dependent oxidoreductase [Desulfobulbaceae bacterium]